MLENQSWQVQTLLAGYHRLQVRIGLGCLQADTSTNCDDISGSPSQLLCRRLQSVEMPCVSRVGGRRSLRERLDLRDALHLHRH